MPLVFAMFILYFLSVSWHLNFEQTHAVDDAMYFDITENANFAYGGEYPFQNGRMGHKNIFDVNSFADFWSWLDLGITPIYWADYMFCHGDLGAPTIVIPAVCLC